MAKKDTEPNNSRAIFGDVLIQIHTDNGLEIVLLRLAIHACCVLSTDDMNNQERLNNPGDLFRDGRRIRGEQV